MPIVYRADFRARFGLPRTVKNAGWQPALRGWFRAHFYDDFEGVDSVG